MERKWEAVFSRLMGTEATDSALLGTTGGVFARHMGGIPLRKSPFEIGWDHDLLPV